MAGYIKVITGGMFSGKSQELTRLIERALIAELSVEIFYPRVAERVSVRDIRTRLDKKRHAVTFHEIETTQFASIGSWDSADVIAVDEAQFFSPQIVEAVKRWRHHGKTVYIAGLDMDYQENPFGSMGALMCLSDDVVKLHAVCTQCKQHPAMISYRLTQDAEQIVVGESNYTALCLQCYDRVQMAEGGLRYSAVGSALSVD
ncbi:MAG: thymidine kinase [Sulfobacillus thermosulfidooxidans]|nr:MAG: thymidine kinase [Sulfobacillus thermosulfidooxidans]